MDKKLYKLLVIFTILLFGIILFNYFTIDNESYEINLYSPIDDEGCGEEVDKIIIPFKTILEVNVLKKYNKYFEGKGKKFIRNQYRLSEIRDEKLTKYGKVILVKKLNTQNISNKNVECWVYDFIKPVNMSKYKFIKIRKNFYIRLIDLKNTADNLTNTNDINPRDNVK